MTHLRVAGAQVNLTVGDIDGNTARILETMEWAESVSADVLLLPELSIPGYPPEDLLLRPGFIADNREALSTIAAASGSVVSIVGFVDTADGRPGRDTDDAGRRTVANAAALVSGGQVHGVYHKNLLPNYGVFDEQRYFVAGSKPDQVWSIGGVPVGVSICEDLWVEDGPPTRQAEAGAAILLNINGSPFHSGKTADRERLVTDQAVRSGVPVVYLNLVGGQDELVFDGDSLVVDRHGQVVYRSPHFEEDRFVVDVTVEDQAIPQDAIIVTSSRERPAPEPLPPVLPPLDETRAMYCALVS
ncbi:MAG: NAD+ synthase, partial [Acidimicrobiia bacterium]|nr:NAD+ synthase [Acidimicrobiia bacterium]